MTARFVRRVNRFAVEVEVEGRTRLAHLPNPGRLTELLVPDRPVLLDPKDRRGRVTAYDLSRVQLSGGSWVSVDSRVPNRLVREALDAWAIPELLPYDAVAPEVSLGQSRIDFLLDGANPCYLEIKSCTLVEDGVALFPDAPTTRGARHVDELAHVVRRGGRAAVLFVVQRGDAVSFRPRDETDPAFGEALRRAATAGVQVLAYRCRVTEEEIVLDGSIPVVLDRQEG